MTREGYFKIADTQALGTMREEMISIMKHGGDSTLDGNVLLDNKNRRSGLEGDRKQQSPTFSFQKSIHNVADKQSDI